MSNLKRPLVKSTNDLAETKKKLVEAVENEQVSYVTPADQGYASLLATKYSNFAVQYRETFPASLEEKVAWAFHTLEAEGFFHRDWVRVKGRSFPTYVSRTLIGDPGVTYKYLGLRLFALPWTFPDRLPETDIERACGVIGELNMYFKQISRKLIMEKNNSDPSSIVGHGDAYATNGEENIVCDTRTSDLVTGVLSESSPSVAEHGMAQTENKNVVIDSSTRSPDQESLDNRQERLTVEQNDHKDNTERISAGALPSAVNQASMLNASPDNNQSPTLNTSPNTNCVITSPRTNHEPTTNASPSANRAPTSNSTNHAPPTSSSMPPSPSLEDGTNFNVCLLNYMDPNDQSLRLKEEPYYGMGELAVSWHMDTGLVPGTTVAVYNHTEQEDCERDDCNKWCVGLKVQWDVETPALAVPLDTGDSYYMLSDLNDTHQHCVVVGSHPRFSSTHRVAECTTGTLSYIQARCHQALQNLENVEEEEDENERTKPRLKSTSIEDITLTEDIHTEVEFDWLRQFWMQGVQRAKERDHYWKQPMEELEHSWHQMELMTQLAINTAMQGSSSEHHSLCNVLIDVLNRRTRQRQECLNRFGGKLLVTMPSDEIPSFRPYWQDSDPSYPLPFDLDNVIHKLECHLDTGSSS